MRFLKILGLLALLLVLVGAVLVFTTDEQFHVERSVVIDAPPEQVHPHVDDFDKWSAWSPFDAADETIEYTYDGARSGVGATRSWTSEQSGAGRQTITRSVPQEGVWMELVLEGEPAEIAFVFEEVEGGTKVTWRDDFRLEGAMKLFGLLLDPLVLGPMFEQGLADLKTAVETA